MDPQTITTEQWEQIARALIYLFLFGGLGLTGALAFLLAHALAPSLIASRDASALLEIVRWLAYPLAGASTLLGAYALIRSLVLAVTVANQIYPRTWI
jgi:hypothetical protein